jgi:SulP family sulfate permease
VAVLFFAGPLMAGLPSAALGAVVFYAAGKLVSIPDFKRLWAFRRREFFLAVIAMLGTVIIGILQGVLFAIALSLLEMLHRLARPHEGVLGRVPGIPGMHDVADYPDARTIPGCIFYRYDAPLFFANVGDLRERVDRVIAVENRAYPDTPVRWFILNVEANVEVDITAADALRELAQELADRGIELGLARVKFDLYEPLDRAGVVDVIGKDMLFATLPVAEEAYLKWAVARAAEGADQPDREIVAEAVDAEPTQSLLPWDRPDEDDDPRPSLGPAEATVSLDDELAGSDERR